MWCELASVRVATIGTGVCARQCVCMYVVVVVIVVVLVVLVCVVVVVVVMVVVVVVVGVGVVVVVVVVGVRVSMRPSVSFPFLSLLVFWWLCMCLAVSGFRSLRGAFGLVIEVCRVVIVLVLSVGLCVLCVCILYFDGLLVFVWDDFVCWLCFPFLRVV